MLSTITGDEAKRARETLGASQTAVAAAIGVNRTYYSLFEAGRYVLDEQEQQQLREFLADALPAGPGSGAGTDDDEDDDGNGDGRASQQPRAASPPAPAGTPSGGGTEKAVDALRALRSAAAEPNGLRTKRTAAAVGDALLALQPLDYAHLLNLAEGDGIPKDALPDLEVFNALDLEGMELWESRVSGLLVCHALYGGQWSALNFDALKDAESELRRTLGDGVPEGEWLWIWDDEEKHTPRRRAELAPSVAQAAQKRRAPTLAQAAR